MTTRILLKILLLVSITELATYPFGGCEAQYLELVRYQQAVQQPPPA